MLKLVFWIIVLLVAFAIFGISIQSIVGNPTWQANLSFLGKMASSAGNWLLLYMHYMFLKLMGAIASGAH